MITAGIVRRIDELGRIVIPKEMRRTMRLKEGDEMEITPCGDALTLRKYSSFESVLPIVRSAAKLLAKQIDGATVLFLDTESVAVAEGKDKKHYQSLTLSEEFAELIRKREAKLLDGGELKNMFKDKDAEAAYCMLEPVIAGGDLVGAAMLLMDEKPSDAHRLYINICVELISAALV